MPPSTPADAKALLTAAIRDDDPVIFLGNLSLYSAKGEVPDGEQVAEIGRAAVVKSGSDLTIVSYSRGTTTALEVAHQLEDEGLSVEVVDLRSLRPLDRETICASVRKTGHAVVFEDDWLSYGIGAEFRPPSVKERSTFWMLRCVVSPPPRFRCPTPNLLSLPRCPTLPR